MTTAGRLAGLAMAGWLALAPALPAVAADLNLAFIGSLSGAHGNVARDQLDGFQLGLKDAGGRLGGVEYSLVTADDRGDRETAVKALQKFTETVRLRVLLLSTEPAVNEAVAAPAIAARTFVISLGPPSAAQAGRSCSPYFFSMSGLAETMPELAGQYMQAQGWKSVAAVGRADDAGQQGALAAFRRTYKGQVAEVTSKRGEMQFGSELKRLRELKPDAVWLLDTGGMAANFLLQYDAAGMKRDTPLYGPATTLDQSLLGALGPAGLDLFSVGPWGEDLDVPANKRMMAEFEAEYGRPASLYAAEGYDAAMLLDAAIKALDKKYGDDDALRAMLRRVEFQSTRGGFRFDTNHMPIQTYYLRQAVLDAREKMVNEQRGVLARDYRDSRAGECPMRWVNDPQPKPATPPAPGAAAH